MRSSLKYSIKHLTTFAVCSTLLSACSTFFDTDNTPAPSPLTNYTAEVAPQLLWSTNVGTGATGYDYLKMSPVVNETAIFTTSTNGTVTAVNRTTGRVIWQTNLGATLTSGPGIGDGLVAVGSQYGVVTALSQTDGKVRWKVTLPGELIANPAIANGVVVVKAVDGTLRGLSTSDGQTRWTYQQTEPNLLLRGSSAPIIRDQQVIAGFANGNLAKLTLASGGLQWVQPIAIPEGAFAIQRMIDIDADPLVFNHDIYVATYQGSIASLNWGSGQARWTHDISSYTGMTADQNAVYISDAKGHVYAFGANSGDSLWQQNKLEYRIVSGPACMGNYIVVGDAEGYLHWLAKSDGHFAGRVSIGSAIYASPVVENNVLYALTKSGYLTAYKLR